MYTICGETRKGEFNIITLRTKISNQSSYKYTRSLKNITRDGFIKQRKFSKAL